MAVESPGRQDERPGQVSVTEAEARGAIRRAFPDRAVAAMVPLRGGIVFFTYRVDFADGCRLGRSLRPRRLPRQVCSILPGPV